MSGANSAPPRLAAPNPNGSPCGSSRRVRAASSGVSEGGVSTGKERGSPRSEKSKRPDAESLNSWEEEDELTRDGHMGG